MTCNLLFTIVFSPGSTTSTCLLFVYPGLFYLRIGNDHIRSATSIGVRTHTNILLNNTKICFYLNLVKLKEILSIQVILEVILLQKTKSLSLPLSFSLTPYSALSQAVALLVFGVFVGVLSLCVIIISWAQIS